MSLKLLSNKKCIFLNIYIYHTSDTRHHGPKKKFLQLSCKTTHCQLSKTYYSKNLTIQCKTELRFKTIRFIYSLDHNMHTMKNPSAPSKRCLHAEQSQGYDTTLGVPNSFWCRHL